MQYCKKINMYGVWVSPSKYCLSRDQVRNVTEYVNLHDKEYFCYCIAD